VKILTPPLSKTALAKLKKTDPAKFKRFVRQQADIEALLATRDRPPRPVGNGILSPALAVRIGRLIRKERPDIAFALLTVNKGPGYAPKTTPIPLPDRKKK
jgi:hypothetical protein